MAQTSKKARVIWSLQSNCLNAEQASLIHDSNVDGVRIEYSPDKKDDAFRFLEALQGHYEDKSCLPAIMLDVTPAARGKIKGLDSKMELVFGSKVLIAPEASTCEHDFEVESSDFSALFTKNATVYLGYGDAVLKVLAIKKDVVEAEVIQGGVLHSNMELHVPETRRSISLDLEKLSFDKFQKLGVNAIVVPGSSDRDQIAALRQQFPKNLPSSPWLIYRVDSQHAFERLEDLVDFIDGIIISRRELALTANPALVPILTKEIIQLCQNEAKVAIVASEMLGSMRYNVTPTRAEVSDIANAVYDGADALMLSEEVPAGEYAQKAYQVAESIIVDIEKNSAELEQNWDVGDVEIRDEMDSVCVNALSTAKRVKASAIVCITKSGNTAVRLSSLNHSIPVIAVTYDPQVKRRLSMLRGVEGIVLNVDPTIDEVLPKVNELLKENGTLNVGDRIVFVTVTLSSMSREASNLFTIQRIS